MGRHPTRRVLSNLAWDEILDQSEFVRLNQVTVGSTDLARAESFYETLGLRIIVRSDHYLRFECPEGDSTFSVELVESVPDHEQVTVYFECDELDTLCDRLTNHGVRLESDPTDRAWLWREAQVRDPDGHRICLFRAGENRRFPPWRLRDGDGT